MAPIALGAIVASAFIAPAVAQPAQALPLEASVVKINEIIYDKVSGYDPDRVELLNMGSETIDLTGWSVADDKNTESLPAGLSIEPGAFLVLEQDVHFAFGLGKGDSFNLFDSTGATVDGYAYEATAPLGTWARCVDGTGEWQHATVVTPGSANICAPVTVPAAVKLNEVDSQPADWVELFNPGSTEIDLSGYEIRDNSDDHRFKLPTATLLPAGGFLVVDENTSGLIYDDVNNEWNPEAFRAAFGIGGADEIRLYDPAGELIDRTGAWAAHAAIDGDQAAATLARCVDGEGKFELATPTPGATNNCVMPTVAINEIESNGDVTDWVEIINTGNSALDISGWTIMDNDPIGHAADVTPLADGTVLDPGAFFVFEGDRHFAFGLGKADTASVRNSAGIVVAAHSWEEHAAGVLARCIDGTGDFRDIAISTKGLQNACGNPVRINEVVTNPNDWIELVNPTDAPLDISGIVVKDNNDENSYTIPDGTVVPARGYYVLESEADFSFGLGKADSVRLFEGENLINATTWGPEHPLPSWGRCTDTTGNFAVTAEATKGAPNVCVGEIAAVAWPGESTVTVLDENPMFLSDSSGLDSQTTSEGTFLWAVDNGTGRFWKLVVAADGSVSFADGWEQGKRARFEQDANNPSAAGPDTEGITVAGDGMIYLAAERDNNAKGVNYNVVLQVDPNAPGPDVVASQQWDLTSLLPQVSANLGLEAIEWVADSDLNGKLWDVNTNAPYDSANYPGHGDGLFFVGVEDQGQILAVALLDGGEARIVAELQAGLGGVMALDYDLALGLLWAVCDDGCQGTAAQLTLNGTDSPEVAHVLRPADMPNINNEGFATAPVALVRSGQSAASFGALEIAAATAAAQADSTLRPVWWFADGYASGSLRLGTLPFSFAPGDGGASDPGTAPGADPGAAADNSATNATDLAQTGATAAPVPLIVAAALLLLLAGGAFVLARRQPGETDAETTK